MLSQIIRRGYQGLFGMRSLGIYELNSFESLIRNLEVYEPGQRSEVRESRHYPRFFNGIDIGVRNGIADVAEIEVFLKKIKREGGKDYLVGCGKETFFGQDSEVIFYDIDVRKKSLVFSKRVKMLRCKIVIPYEKKTDPSIGLDSGQ